MITFFNRGTVDQLRFLENAVNFKFKRIGAPQKSEMFNSVLARELKSISEISETNYTKLVDKASEFIEEYGAVGVAKLLSRIVGIDTTETVSMLSGQPGYSLSFFKCSI